jgi:hypothetical protein
VGTPDVEAEVLRLRYLRPVPRSIPSPFCGSDFEKTALGTQETWDAVFNIDPPGCRDVDDILAWRRCPTGGYEFGIGIAHVAALVPHGSALDGAARLRAQTLYREGVAIEPMLPPAISEGAGSLLADGKSRGVVWAIWCIDEEGLVTGPVWRSGHVVNQKTYTYNSVLEDAEVSNRLPQLLAALPDVGGVAAVGSDPHHWVEVAMIAYKRAAAEQLGTVGILRRHAGIRATEYQGLAATTGCRDLAFLGYAAGEYVDAGVAAGAAAAHAGLGLARYCHATSPLRRYADLVNQRILVGMLEAENVQDFVETGIADWLNERAKEARVYEREAWCLAQLSAKELRSANGWVLGWTSMWTRTSNTPPEVRLRIYVPAWRRSIKVPMAFHGEGTETGGGKEGARIRVGSRGTSETFEVRAGSSVHVTAFWNTRSTPEHRFVFHCTPMPVGNE